MSSHLDRALKTLKCCSLLFCQKDMEESRKCIKRLIDHSTHTLNWQDFEGRTPLHLAVTNEDCNATNLQVILKYKRYSILFMDNDYQSINRSMSGD